MQPESLLNVTGKSNKGNKNGVSSSEDIFSSKALHRPNLGIKKHPQATKIKSNRPQVPELAKEQGKLFTHCKIPVYPIQQDRGLTSNTLLKWSNRRE